jgi:ubiquinone biosynthesis protein UbiJ
MSGTPFGPTLKTAAFAALEGAINTALRLDPASRQKLAALNGRVFHLECTKPDLDIFLLPQQDGVQLAAHWEGDISAGLSGSGDDFMQLLRSSDPAATLINGNMTVIGDSKALLQLRDIAAQLDLDWEAPLTRVFGDIVGHQMARSLRFGHRLFRDAASSLQRQVRDYFQEENTWVAQRWQFDQFQSDIETLQSRSEQLVARAAQLQQRVATKTRAPQSDSSGPIDSNGKTE